MKSLTAITHSFLKECLIAISTARFFFRCSIEQNRGEKNPSFPRGLHHSGKSMPEIHRMFHNMQVEISHQEKQTKKKREKGKQKGKYSMKGSQGG